MVLVLVLAFSRSGTDAEPVDVGLAEGKAPDAAAEFRRETGKEVQVGREHVAKAGMGTRLNRSVADEEMNEGIYEYRR